VITFGARLKAIRARRGVTQQWLAIKAGVSYAAIVHYENDGTVPSADNLARLADALGFTMDELWRGGGRCEPYDDDTGDGR
jgi:transcriptional regulator with XRE-family HTH domain